MVVMMDLSEMKTISILHTLFDSHLEVRWDSPVIG